jgi:ankyrin repeat protein
MKAARWGGEMALDDMKKLLYDDMLDINVIDESTGETALQIASSAGRSHITKWLIELGADVDAVSDGGSTPLMHASRRGHSSIVKQLLDANADSLVQHKRSGWTALHIAALHLDRDSSRMLVGYNVDACSILDKKNRTPLELAASKDASDELVDLLSSFCLVASVVDSEHSL